MPYPSEEEILEDIADLTELDAAIEAFKQDPQTYTSEEVWEILDI